MNSLVYKNEMFVTELAVDKVIESMLYLGSKLIVGGIKHWQFKERILQLV